MARRTFIVDYSGCVCPLQADYCSTYWAAGVGGRPDATARSSHLAFLAEVASTVADGLRSRHRRMQLCLYLSSCRHVSFRIQEVPPCNTSLRVKADACKERVLTHTQRALFFRCTRRVSDRASIQQAGSRESSRPRDGLVAPIKVFYYQNGALVRHKMLAFRAIPSYSDGNHRGYASEDLQGFLCYRARDAHRPSLELRMGVLLYYRAPAVVWERPGEASARMAPHARAQLWAGRFRAWPCLYLYFLAL